MTNSGTTYARGAEVLVELTRGPGHRLRQQLEDALRRAVRDGRLQAGAKMPATRVLAVDLGVSRRLVVEAYDQLLAEGYLATRRGAGTYVAAEAASTATVNVGDQAVPSPRFDFFPGYPDLAGFPRRAWLRALRETLAAVPAHSLGRRDSLGAAELRHALAEYLRRVRGVVTDPERVVVCSGIHQGLVLLARAMGAPHVAIEDPGQPRARAILAAHGARLTALPVDAEGAQVAELARIEHAHGRPDAVLVTPAHQSPTGVALTRERRTALLAWATGGGLVIEDDYDAEYRYDRPPLAALQALAPDRVIYMGTVSKTLAPALRLGWMVLPAHLVAPVAEQRQLADLGSPTLDQLALARLISSGAYDRHLRLSRRLYRARRDALVRAVNDHLPRARVTGLAAGLHAIVRLDRDVDNASLMHATRRRSVAIYPLGTCFVKPRLTGDGLVLGYANLTETDIGEGVRRLADALRECTRTRG